MSELQRAGYAELEEALKASIPDDMPPEDRKLAEAIVSVARVALSDINRIADALEQLAQR